MMVRSDLLGLTSLIRALNLRPKLYNSLRGHFHSSAIKLDKLVVLWDRTVLRLFSNPVRFNGRLVLVGDGIKIPFGQKTHLTAFSCSLLMIITQEPAQSLAALDAPLTIEVTVPRK
jgi:hypothetical protein